METTIQVGRRCEWAPSDGALRAFADGEIEDGWRHDIDAHVRACEECRERSQALRANASLAHKRLRALEPTSSNPITAPSFDSILVSAPVPWHARLLLPRRSAWVANAGAVAAAITLVAFWPAVSSFADGALQSFRVQRVQPITVDAELLRGRFAGLPIDDEKVREALRYRGPDKPNVTITSQGDAAARSGLALRLPKSVPAAVASKPARFVVSSSGSAEMTVDGPKLVQVAKDAKITDGALLARLGALDGVTVKVDVSPAVVAVWGDVDLPTQIPSGKAGASMPAPVTRGPVMFLGQMRSPVVNVPASVDVEGLRDAMLKSGSVPPELVQALSTIKDWRTTLPIPIGGVSGLRSVDVDGVTGSMSTRSRDGRSSTTLMWIRDGVMIFVVGEVPEADILAAARSLAPVK